MRSIIITIAFAITLIGGTSVILYQTEAQTLRAQLVQQNGEIMNQVHHRLEDKVAQFTQGWLDIGAERRKRGDELQAGAMRAQQVAVMWAWTTAVALVVALLLSAMMDALAGRRVRAGVAMACWVLGLALPVLTLTVETDVTSPVNLGRLLLREETKSLITLLASLWAAHDVLMLTLVGVFGVAVPMVKTICQMMPEEAHAAHALSKFLTRWALVDVLVVGVIVAFLGSQGGKEAHAEFRLGFWLFAASGVLSVLGTWFAPTSRIANAGIVPATQPIRHPFGSTF